MPDIDIDIPDIYRPDFIRYVGNKYGSKHAAQIVTFSTFGAKQALRDVLNVLVCQSMNYLQLPRKSVFGTISSRPMRVTSSFVSKSIVS